MFNKFVFIFSLIFFINFSCEEAEEAVLCADASLELANTLNSFNDSQMPWVGSSIVNRCVWALPEKASAIEHFWQAHHYGHNAAAPPWVFRSPWR